MRGGLFGPRLGRRRLRADGGRRGDGVDALGFRVSTAGVGGYRVFFFLQQLSTPTSRRAGVRRRRTATGAGTRAGVRTTRSVAYAGGRMTSRADVRRRVGIPIPNVKLPYYPLYVLGGGGVL